MPGLVAKKLYPDILKALAEINFPDGVIVVTGTNGKTTTSKMISDILTKAGISHIHNRAGSNLERGIIATILEHADSKGRCKARMGLFEVDEAYVPSVSSQLQPRYIVITNLFRDQLDRYGELDKTATRLGDALLKLNTKAILNADDPLVASLGLNLKDDKRVVYFGISDYKGNKTEHDYALDSVFDPNTGDMLKYSQRYFGHLGIYSAPNSSFKRPKPSVDLVSMLKNDQEGSKFEVENEKTKLNLQLPLGGTYNIYNALAAVALAITMGLEPKAVELALAESSAAFGRMETIEYDERKLLLLLIKNPTGFNQIIQTYLKSDLQKPLWLIINDKLADGRDVSWLWDSALEDIKDYAGAIVVSGTRAYDMALRLKYAGIDKNVSIEPELEDGLRAVINKVQVGETVHVLPTYTAMLALREKLVKDTKGKEFWQ